jgi:glycerol-3-phosphate dehydrogenase (NAD(P)+)
LKITVIGPGRWGSLITWYLDTKHHDVTLYGKKGTPHIQSFLETRSNNLLTLPESVKLSTDLSCVNDAQVIVISIPSQALQGLFDELKEYNIKNKIFVLCMKGIEISTGRRLSEIAKDNLDPSNKVAVWLGPGHVQEFYHGIPNCMVIDSEEESVKKLLVDEFSSSLIRFYYGTDLIGNEIGAAAKNVIGIAAGFLDGIGLSSLKGALMARGTREIARLIKAQGGNEMSAYGLCHLGDYEATVFSKYSHNRQYGESFVKKEEFESLAEGYYTVKALLKMGEKSNVDLPICKTVYSILYENKDPVAALDDLFSRQLTNEF